MQSISFVFSLFLVPFSHSNLPSKCLPVWDSLLQFGPRNFLLLFVFIIFRTSDSLSNQFNYLNWNAFAEEKNLINQISGRHTKRAIDPKVRLKIKKSASAWIIFVFVIVWINGLIENLDKEKTFTEKQNKIKKYYSLRKLNDMLDVHAAAMTFSSVRRMQFESGYENIAYMYFLIE